MVRALDANSAGHTNKVSMDASWDSKTSKDVTMAKASDDVEGNSIVVTITINGTKTSLGDNNGLGGQTTIGWLELSESGQVLVNGSLGKDRSFVQDRTSDLNWLLNQDWTVDSQRLVDKHWLSVHDWFDQETRLYKNKSIIRHR